MLITREMDYAIRAVRALADGEQHNIKEICSMEDIPTEFGYKVLKKLSHSEIVTVIRGQGGGYRLLCDLNETTLLDIARAIGGNLLLNECLEGGYICVNNSGEKVCTVHKELCRIQNVLIAELKANTLAQILAM